MRDPKSVLRYQYNFSCGGSTHELALYRQYDPVTGLGEKLAVFKESKIDLLLNQIEHNELEAEAVRKYAQERVDSAIIDRYGCFLSDY